MILISAMTRDRVIGAGDGMPWSIPDEYAQFLDFVRGQVVVMGRRSWEIFGGDLGESENLVISRSVTEMPGARVLPSLEAALEAGRASGKQLFVAGGARVYAQALPLADAMYLSTIRGDYAGDAYFPEFDRKEWEIVEERAHPDFDFVIYRRRRR